MFGIAIPCYNTHIPLLKRSLDSIENQTIKPDFVVVSCSSSKSEDIPNYTYSFPLEIISTEEFQDASQNRNRAAGELVKKGCNYISFFDCDDEMHQQRIEALQKGFEIYPDTQLIVHNYLSNFEVEEEFEIYDSYQYIYQNFDFKSKYKIAKGHITVTNDLFSKVKFREGNEFWGKEDTIFCGECISLNLNKLYIGNPLCKYYPSQTWDKINQHV